MSFVGLNIDKCTELKAHLDQACQDLNAHAATVDALLAQAGIVSCRAGAELRDVAAWANYRSRDLQKRIDRARAADSGSIWGSRFGGDRKAASEAGVAEAKKIKDLMNKVPPDREGLEKELAKVKASADDPAFATAFIHRIGSAKLVELLRGIDCADERHPLLSHEAVATLAALLASVSQAKPNDSVLKNVLTKASPAELGTLLEFGGFGSDFVAKAALVILRAYPPAAVANGVDYGAADGYRQSALHALAVDPRACFLFLTDNGKDGYRALLQGEDRDGGRMTGLILREGLLDAPKTGAEMNAARRVLQGIIHDVAKGDVQLTGGAKEALAVIVYPLFAEGLIARQVMDPHTAGDHVNSGNDFLSSAKDLEGFFAQVLRDDQARKEVMVGARDYLAGTLASGLAAVREGLGDPAVDAKGFYETPAAYVAGVYNLLNDAANKAIADDAARAEFLIGLAKSAVSMAVTAGLAGVTGGTGIAAHGVVNYVVDQAFKIGGTTVSADILKNRNQIAAALRPAVIEAVAAVLWSDPAYRKYASFSPNVSWMDPSTGNLRLDTPQQLDAFWKWVGLQQNKFGSQVAFYTQPVLDHLVDAMVIR
jgi:hypothetical protein